MMQIVGVSVLFMLSLSSCHHEQKQAVLPVDSLNEHLINANKLMVKDESKDIEDFIARHGWKMTGSGTGLRYEIFEKGNGRKTEPEKQLSISYSVSLLDGTTCYVYDQAHPVEFIPGHGEQARGLEEGVLLMREGDHARLVVPSHLAFGKSGDNNKIPGNSALYYEVIVLKVKDLK